jgi:hypothetical protein
MLRSGELEKQREYLASTLPDIGEILEKVAISDGMGGETENWEPVQKNLRCRLTFRRGATYIAGARLTGESWWELVLPFGTSITTKNRFRLNGADYAITALDIGKSNALSVRARVDRV